MKLFPEIVRPNLKDPTLDTRCPFVMPCSNMRAYAVSDGKTCKIYFADSNPGKTEITGLLPGMRQELETLARDMLHPRTAPTHIEFDLILFDVEDPAEFGARWTMQTIEDALDDGYSFSLEGVTEALILGGRKVYTGTCDMGIPLGMFRASVHTAMARHGRKMDHVTLFVGHDWMQDITVADWSARNFWRAVYLLQKEFPANDILLIRQNVGVRANSYIRLTMEDTL